MNQDVVFSPDSTLVAAATETGVAIFKTGTVEPLWGTDALPPLRGALPLAFDDHSDHLAVATNNSIAVVRVDRHAKWAVLPPELAGEWEFTKVRGPANAVPRALTGSGSHSFLIAENRRVTEWSGDQATRTLQLAPTARRTLTSTGPYRFLSIGDDTTFEVRAFEGKPGRVADGFPGPPTDPHEQFGSATPTFARIGFVNTSYCNPRSCAAIAPDGSAVAVGAPHELRLYTLDDELVAQQAYVTTDFPAMLTGMGFTPKSALVWFSGNQLFSRTPAGAIISIETRGVSHMVVDKVVYLIGKTSVELRDPETLELKHRVEGAGERAFLSLSPNGKWLAVGDEKNLRIVRMRDGAELIIRYSATTNAALYVNDAGQWAGSESLAQSELRSMWGRPLDAIPAQRESLVREFFDGG